MKYILNQEKVILYVFFVLKKHIFHHSSNSFTMKNVITDAGVKK